MTRLAWVIIADDLTGACDTGAAFAGQGWMTRVSLAGATGINDAAVWAFTTESRMMPAAQAASAVQRAARNLDLDAGVRFYKKIDSTLRGNPGAELAALMITTGLDRCLICPAFPQQQRVVRDGSVFVGGKLLSETEFMNGAGKSHLQYFFAPCSPSQYLHLMDIRSGVETVRAFLARPGVTIADAETLDDLKILAEAGELAGVRLYCGSAGLAGALAARSENHRTRTHISPPAGAIIIVVGSRSETSKNQCKYLEEQGVRSTSLKNNDLASKITRQALADQTADQVARGRVMLISAAKLGPVTGGEQQVAAALADIAQAVMKREPAGGLILTGGDTAFAVCQALDCTAIELYGEVQPGLGWGVLADGAYAGLPVVTKAGGFGSPETLMDALLFLQGLQEKAEG